MCRSALTARWQQPTMPCAGGFVRRRPPGHGQPGCRRIRPVQGQRRGHRQNANELDALAAIADSYGAQLRLTRSDPRAGRRHVGHPAPDARAAAHAVPLVARATGRPHGDSFFHLSALGQPLDGLNLCGAGRVVCLIDPVGDVYACPFVIDGNSWRQRTPERRLPRSMARVRALRIPARAAERGRVRIVRFVRCLPGRVHGGEVLHRAAARRPRPECVFGHGRRPWPPVRISHARPRPLEVRRTGRPCRCPPRAFPHAVRA